MAFATRFLVFVALVTLASVVGNVGLKLLAARGPAGLQAVVGAGT
jgi:hypothetical protein